MPATSNDRHRTGTWQVDALRVLQKVALPGLHLGKPIRAPACNLPVGQQSQTVITRWRHSRANSIARTSRTDVTRGTAEKEKKWAYRQHAAHPGDCRFGLWKSEHVRTKIT